MDDHDKTLDSADGEDIPSDFFDDFSKDEFVEGLSIVDSWEDCDKDKNPKRRYDSEEPSIEKEHRHSTKDSRYYDSKREEKYSEREARYLREGHGSGHRRSGSNIKLDDYIKPGSRRDPNKTNEAIRRDKEVKVKEHLAKHLESTDDIRPPGTELDDFFNFQKVVKKTKSTLHEEPHKKSVRSRSKEYRERDRRTPPKKSNYKHEEHQKNTYRSSYRSPRQSPRPYRSRNWRPSPSRSYRRYSPHHTVRRYSPRKSRHSRSPARDHTLKSRRSSSSGYKDSFLYPNVSKTPAYTPQNSYEIDPGPSYVSAPISSYTGAPINEFSIPGSSYIQDQVYAGSFSGYNGYMGQPMQSAVPEPQPVPTTVMDQASGPIMSLAHPPSMVPAPIVVPSANTTMQQYQMDQQSPYDALAQLVADGKLSQEDYLKLAPNKGGTMLMNDKARVMVLSRCDEAISKLSTLILPNHLLINNNLLAPELKSITPKYCSPLKRHQTVEFHFTKAQNSLTPRQNRQLLDSIIACIGFEQVVPKSKKKNKDMKDVAVQTMKPYCDVCEIRGSTNFNEAGTSIDPDYFCSTVHTQVLEQDLINSKSIFNPSGSVGVSEPISIAHLTPAQLVSQLAARAKTLKQTETRQPSNQFGRRNQPNNFDGRGGGQQYHYDNYRY